MGSELTVGYDPNRRTGLEQMLGVEFFDGIEAADPKFLTAEGLAFNVNLPPLFIVTCGDDFLEADNLALAAALARKGADFELFDPKPRRHETLGHVFVIGMPTPAQVLVRALLNHECLHATTHNHQHHKRPTMHYSRMVGRLSCNSFRQNRET